MVLLDILFKFVVTFLLSSLFGLERQTSHKPIGFGTFTFVAVGSCALGILAGTLGLESSIGLLGATITGIGFLGAGALIKTGDKIFGANTAAAIWLFAIFGLIMGLGEFMIGGVVYGLVWLTVLFDRFLEHHSLGSYQKKLTINTNEIIDENELESVIGKKSKVLGVEVNKKCNTISFTCIAEGTKEEINEIPKKLFKKKWFESFRTE
jgi:putative Mg2+ transporter-C (MgtC) family protein